MALGAVALVILVILNLPAQSASRLKLAIGSLFLPLFGLATSGQQAAERAADTLTPRSQLVRENEQLRRENAQLRLHAVQSAEIFRENARLRQLLGWQQKQPWKLKLAHVVLRDPANWWRTRQIDLGSRDGIRPDLPILSPEGYLIGRVGAVSLTHSQIVLLGDPTCRVAALVENEARDTGMIGVAGPFDGSLVEMSFLPPNAVLKPGQNVSTSGLGSIFPKGIPIGKVVDFRPVEYGLSMQARVKLGANLSSLEEVWVLFP